MSQATQMQHRTTEVISSPEAHTVAPALEVSGISKSFSHRRRETNVLNNVSLKVEQQEFVSIVGPSGCGKSTLFHMIGGLVKPDAGTIRMNGKVVTGQRGEISYMPQQPALFPWRTIEDNVLLAGEIRRTAGWSPRGSAPVACQGWVKRFRTCLSAYVVWRDAAACSFSQSIARSPGANVAG